MNHPDFSNKFTLNRQNVLSILFFALFAFASPIIGSSQETRNLSVFEDAYPYWSPDGRQIVFHSTRIEGVDQVFLMNSDGSGVRQLTFTNEANRTPVFSPNGTKIAFQSERDGVREIYVMNADGSNQTRLTEGTEESSHPKWSYDGTQIIFDSHRDHPDTQMANLYIMNADGSGVERLTTYVEYDSYSSLSPDGTKILFRRVTPTGGNSQSGRNSEVFIMNRDGSNLENLTNHPDFDGYPSWAPDGQWVLFASNRGGSNSDEFNIFAVRPDGSDLRKITETLTGVLQARQIVSADGKKIVLNRDFPGGRIEIHTMNFLPEK